MMELLTAPSSILLKVTTIKWTNRHSEKIIPRICGQIRRRITKVYFRFDVTGGRFQISKSEEIHSLLEYHQWNISQTISGPELKICMDVNAWKRYLVKQNATSLRPL